MTKVATQELDGGLGVVKGLQVAGVSAGFRRNPAQRDLALIVAPDGSRAAGVFTQSAFAAAPVTLSKKHLEQQAEGKGFKALIINSGNANAATGEQGVILAREVCALLAQKLGSTAEQILIASTGVIGVQQSLAPFEDGVVQSLAKLGEENRDEVAAGQAAAEAIMTTDTVPKTAARSFCITQEDGSRCKYTIGGMAKGSGMIAPNMATMIAVLGTDALLEQGALKQALKRAVEVSFNKVTIDSDTSTNDSAYLLATGAAKDARIAQESEAYQTFVEVLTEVCQDLSYQIARDGEGATKVIVVDLVGAASKEDAALAARAIADSPLVKTAVAGHDANWGRIAMAAGKSGATFNAEEVSISIMGLKVFYKGAPFEFSEDEALKRFEERDEVLIFVDLGAGEESTRMWTCDLTKEYIAINGDYRT